MVVPKKLRARLALEEGGEVEVTERDGVIELTPIAADVGRPICGTRRSP